jgi:hypothetical protein
MQIAHSMFSVARRGAVGAKVIVLVEDSEIGESSGAEGLGMLEVCVTVLVSFDLEGNDAARSCKLEMLDSKVDGTFEIRRCN